MKRSKAIVLALLAFAIGGIVEAVPVSRLQATAAAQSWVREGVRLGARVGAQAEKTTALTTADGVSYYAVKMHGGGTVLLSGDTDYEPILAFTPETNDFSTIEKDSPLEALIAADLAFRRRAVAVKAGGPVQPQSANQTGSYATAAAPNASASAASGGETAASRRWARLLPESGVSENGLDAASPIKKDANVLDDMRVDILLKTKWGQSSSANYVTPCFNYYTPENCVCGCVATAMAQLMRYHCWPTNDVPKFSKTCTVNNVPKLLTSLGGAFDWANMPEVDVTSEDECKAMGRLTYECGVSVQMDYTSTSSGAVTAYVPDELKAIFAYTNALWCSQGSALTSDETMREKYVYPSLDAGYPVLFSIRGNVGGHAVVCDGYGYNDVDGEATPYVHINMGWTGQNDWWYNLPNIDIGDNPESFTGFDVLSGVGYDIFPTVQGRVVSGRVLDDDGEPVVGALVTLGDTTVATTNHGVYAFVARMDNGPVEVFAESEDGRYVGDIEFDLESGDSWGHDIVISRPSVEVNGIEFSTFDKALAYAATNANPTIKILLDTDFRHSFTITNACTIVATNPVPTASMILPKTTGVKLTLAAGADVTFENVAFRHDDRQMVEAKAGSVLRVSGVADLGGIRLATVDNLRLTGELKSAIVVDAPFAKAHGETFGRIEGASPTACESYAATASCLLDAYDDETGGEGHWSGSGYVLRWKFGAEVPPAAAAVKYEDGVGQTASYRSLSVFFKYHPNGGTAAILKNVALTNDVTLTDALTLYGAASGPVAVTPSATARLTVGEGGSLVVSNLTVSGYSGPRLFRVVGGEMTLAEGAVLSDLARDGQAIDYGDKTTIDAGGALILESGTFNLLPGAAIRGCSVTGDGGFIACGGGLYACGGTLNLLGGEISGCVAERGGGVYADMIYGDLDVSLGGDLRISGNWHEGVSSLEADNLCINGLAMYEEDTVYRPTVSSALSGAAEIGVNYDADATGNGRGETFALVGAALSGDEATAAANAFFNDFYMTYCAEAAEAGVGTVLRWVVSTVDPANARALAVYDDGTPRATTNYFGSVEEAFASLTNDAKVVVLRNEIELSEDIAVNYRVVFCSDAGPSAPPHLKRNYDTDFEIVAGASLVVSNLWFDGLGVEKLKNDEYDVNPLFDVTGGSLALGGNTVVSNLCGNASPTACAVYVTEQGVVTLEADALLVACVNYYQGTTAGVAKDADAGLAGGLVIAGGTAYLRGGKIARCTAQKGGGVFVGNDSTVHVSGSFLATENGCWKDSASYPSSRRSNITYDGNGRICLDGVYTGMAGAGCGWNVSAPCSSNVFGTVEYDGDPYDLLESARRFSNDRETSSAGAIVTNATDALLVWSSALQVDEQSGEIYFEDESGNRYGAVTSPEPGPTPPGPEPEPTVTNYPTPIAFKSITRLSDTVWSLVVTDRVIHCNYRLLSTDDLAKGFVTTGDWVKAEADGAWTTNVMTTTERRFWKADATWGEVPSE